MFSFSIACSSHANQHTFVLKLLLAESELLDEYPIEFSPKKKINGMIIFNVFQ